MNCEAQGGGAETLNDPPPQPWAMGHHCCVLRAGRRLCTKANLPTIRQHRELRALKGETLDVAASRGPIHCESHSNSPSNDRSTVPHSLQAISVGSRCPPSRPSPSSRSWPRRGSPCPQRPSPRPPWTLANRTGPGLCCSPPGFFLRPPEKRSPQPVGTPRNRPV